MNSIASLAKTLAVLFIIFSAIFFTIELRVKSLGNDRNPFFAIQSIDVMKYSRDIAREKLHDASFNNVISDQVSNIARTGATHIAIATPYDDEFAPFLGVWVSEARKHNLNVWFRGNFSGWEGWFGYPKITREEHIEKTKQFILNHPDLFKDGDIFTGCPECENGGPGDPRITGDVEGFRKFLIDEHNVMKEAFKAINKNVDIRVNSMNGDVANLIMDKKTTQALEGIVAIDHYVKTPEQLNNDVTSIAQKSGGLVVLGEWGAPIPDIHGNLTEEEQAEWISKALSLLSDNQNLYGLNYWVNVGGSTKLWDDDGTPRKAVEALSQYYNPNTIGIILLDGVRRPIKNASFEYEGNIYTTDTRGYASVRTFDSAIVLPISIERYKEKEVYLSISPSSEKIILQNSIL